MKGIRSWIADRLGIDTFLLSEMNFYEPLEEGKRVGDYLYAPPPPFVYRNKLRARLAAFLADHPEYEHVGRERIDLFTEDGGRSLWRMRASLLSRTGKP